MADSEETKLKAEIDHIVKTIKDTIRKIERVVPFNSEATDNAATEESTSETAKPLDKA